MFNAVSAVQIIWVFFRSQTHKWLSATQIKYVLCLQVPCPFRACNFTGTHIPVLPAVSTAERMRSSFTSHHQFNSVSDWKLRSGSELCTDFRAEDALGKGRKGCVFLDCSLTVPQPPSALRNGKAVAKEPSTAPTAPLPISFQLPGKRCGVRCYGKVLFWGQVIVT